MKTKVLSRMLIVVVLLVGVGIVTAHEDFSVTKKLIDSNISCSELSEGQLEEMGDYYMEQMHPGEAHEMMHDMMGGHDSELTKEMHINMAKGIYCDEDVDMRGSGMMGMMQGRGMMGGQDMMDSGDMMSSGMMNGMMGRQMQTNMMTGNAIQGMMGNWQYGYGYWNFVDILYVTLLIVLIILACLVIVKLSIGLKTKRR